MSKQKEHEESTPLQLLIQLLISLGLHDYQVMIIGAVLMTQHVNATCDLYLWIAEQYDAGDTPTYQQIMSKMWSLCDPATIEDVWRNEEDE